MAPKKNSTDLSQNVAKKKSSKPASPLKKPAVVKVQIGSSVALAKLRGKTVNLLSPKPAATPSGLAQKPETAKKSPKKPAPVKRKKNNKSADVESLDAFETETVKKSPKKQTPAKRKNTNKLANIEIPDAVITQEPKKRKPEPKSKAIPQTKKKPVLNPLVRISNELPKIKMTLTKPVTRGRKIVLKPATNNSTDVICRGNRTSDVCENAAPTPTPPKRPKGRPKGSKNKPAPKPALKKTLNAEETKASSFILESVLGNSPRPNSVNSNKSNISWTKDISTESSVSSGTTTCVTVVSNDFTDDKQPLQPMQVDNVEQPKVDDSNFKERPHSKMSKSDSSSSDSDSSSSSSSDSELDRTNSKPDLNLSTSSLTPKSPLSDSTTLNCIELGLENVKLNKLLENFNLEIGELVPQHDDPCTYSDILEIADPHISDLVKMCENFDVDLEAKVQKNYSFEKSVNYFRAASFTEQNELKNRCLDSKCTINKDNSNSSSPERYRPCQKGVQNDSDGEFVKPYPVRRVSVLNTRETAAHFPDVNLVANRIHQELSPSDSFKTFTSDNYVYVPFDRSHDDEDALSLYAESITGVESSRLDSASVSNVSLQDVYVPKYSPKTLVRNQYDYKPTKIQEHGNKVAEESMKEGEIFSNMDVQEQEQDTRSNVISRPCVSSSFHSTMNKTAMELLEDSNRMSSFAEESIKRVEAQISSRPPRLFSLYQTSNPIKSSLYRGYCFFHMVLQCKYNKCRFSHADLDSNTFKCRLKVLSEDNLISEYLLICCHMRLKRKYCLLFVEECSRRKATRTLFEMAIELGLGIVEVEPEVRAQVLETALLYLNTVSLDACDDLLKVEHRETMLCDALLQCMANSQNFAQFKRAFAKLAHLTCELRRPVEAAVAGSILERVVILPGEEVLARGMLALMQNAGGGIFRSRLADAFEQQLAGLDGDALEVYLRAKEAARGGRPRGAARGRRRGSARRRRRHAEGGSATRLAGLH